MKILPYLLLSSLVCCADQEKPNNQTWTIDTQADWNENLLEKNGVEISDGLASPTGKIAVLSSVIKQFDEKRSAQSIMIDQSTAWLNWNPIGEIGPKSLSNAPIFLRMGEDDYWLFGGYKKEQR